MPHDYPTPGRYVPRRTIARTAIATLHFLARWLAWLVRNPVAWSSAVSRTLVILRQGGVTALWSAVLYKSISRQSGTDANAWYRRYRSHSKRSDRPCYDWPADAPLLRVVVNVAALDERNGARLMQSVLRQGYPHWELWCCVDGGADVGAKLLAARYATYDPRVRLVTLADAAPTLDAPSGQPRERYVVFAERVAEFEPAAFAKLAEGVLYSHADLVYGDYVIADDNDAQAIAEVAALPGYSYEFFLTTGYFAGNAVVRGGILREIDTSLIRSTLGHDSFALLLHALERSLRVTHVPAIIARWKHATIDLAQRVAAVEQHGIRVGGGTAVRAVPELGTLEIGVDLTSHEPRARVAIVIPTRNARELLQQCVESLHATGAFEWADLWIVDHRTDEPLAVAYLEQLSRRHHVVRATGEFNYSRLVNLGVAAAGAAYSHYLLLNNDIEAITSGWLDHFIATALRPGVGAVGATLLYPDGTIQHAGVVLGMRGLAGHYQLGLNFHDEDGSRSPGPQKCLLATRETTAVTAACVLVSRQAWQAVAGFDESIAVGYGDVDFCLRLQMAGFRILHDPHAVLVHHESRTRGRALWDPHPADTRRFLNRYRSSILAGDPYYSPLLSNVLTQCQLGRARPGIPRTSTRCLPRPVFTEMGISDGRGTEPARAFEAAA